MRWLLKTVAHKAPTTPTGIEEIDLNPVIAHPHGHGLTVVDALIVKRQPANLQSR